MRIEIVENIKEKMEMDNKYVDDVINGKSKISKKKSEKTIVITPEIFSKIFSPERIKLMLKIKKNNIKNIYQLAKTMNRKYEAVYRDIKLLEGFGIIQLKKKDKKTVPFMDEAVTIAEFAE
jgi:predicted transcriptional regulator